MKQKLYLLLIISFTQFICLGQMGKALDFDGIDDRVNLGNSLSTLIDPLNTITVEAWVYPTQVTAYNGCIIGNYSYPTDNGQVQFSLRRDGNSYVFFINDGTGLKFVTASNSVTLNTWTHIAGVWDGSTIKIYINGILSGTTTNVIGSSFVSLSNSFAVGFSYAGSPDEAFKGSIDEIRIWSTARTQTQIDSYKSAELTLPQTGLLRYYKFNQGVAGGTNTSETTLIDSSGNANNGTLSNFALNGTTSNWVGNSPLTPATHLNFDGIDDYVQIPKTFSSDFTIEYWVKTASTGGNSTQWYGGTPIVDNEIAGVQNDFGTALVGNKLAFGVGNPDVTLFSTTDINNNMWHHIAVSWKQSTGRMELYVDGILENSAIGSTAPRTAYNFIRLATFSYNVRYFNGSIDDLRIWNTVRTAEQINGSKNCELQGTETGLVAYYNFNQGIDVANNTGITTLTATTGTNGTLNNFALSGSTSNWLAGSQVTTGSIVPSNATVTTPVVYNQGASSSALSATAGANGTGLLWYTSATGGTGSTTAPTPSTATAGTTSYWVSSTNANGCESARVEIVVQVNTPATHLNFDGVNDYVENSTPFTSFTNEITVECWVKRNGNITIGSGIGQSSNSDIMSQNVWLLHGNTDNTFTFLVNQGGVWKASGSSSVLPLNTWTHIAAVANASGVRIYVNGVLNNSTATGITTSILSNSSAHLHIGKDPRYPTGSNRNFNGSFDEVRIWNTARTVEQILGSMNCELQGTETGLVSYYNFNQGIDAANNTGITTLTATTGTNGTLNNFALSGSTSNWLAGSQVTTGSIVPSNATVTTPVVYNQGATASALTATTGTNGTGLLWYTSATGGTGSTTAPTPSTTTAGSTSYWVSSTNTNGCGSARVEIIVQVNAPATHLNFDGVNDYVNCGNILTNSYTKEAWVYVTNSSLQNNFISGGDLDGKHAIWAPNSYGNRLSAGHNDSWNQVQDPTPLNLNTWYHVAVTYDASSTTMKLYKNGILVSTNNSVAPFINGNALRLGAFNNANNQFGGNLDEVRVWDYARTIEQINGSKNCELQGVESGLIAYYNFNQGFDTANNSTVTSLPDLTSNAYNGTLNNFALTGSTSNWLAGSPVASGSIVPSNATVTTPVVYNQGATASALTATTGTNGTGLLWYTTATGGTGSTTAPTPSTATAGSTSYWVSSTNANGCESARAEIIVNIIPSAPTASAQTFCNTATVADLVATGSGLQWYSASTGGSALATTTSLSTATYYVSQTVNGIESARTAVSVTVNVTPAPTASSQTFCNTATVADLVATGSGLQWYASSTGGSALASTTSLSSNTYYVSQTISGCESATRTAVSVTVNVTPSPTASAQTFCNTATVADLVATGSGLQWYASSTGGSALASTTSLSTNTYYVSQTISGCESATRTAVSVTVNVTPSPTASSQTFCNTATVADLVATGSGLQWYASSTGGSALVSTTSLTTATYYVSQTVNGCESATRTAVSVTVNVTPAPTASAQTFCNTATVADLVATGSGLQWYASSTGGSALASTTSLTTATYYVSQTISGCESATRTAVSVTVNVTPAPTASVQTFCNTATVADLVATGSGLQWYASSTGGSALASTTSLTTATYYVSQTVNGCESATRTAVSVTMATIGLIRQHWNDVIFFDNSSNEYVSYQWFKNGVLVPGENNQFFKENGDLDGIYFAKAMTTSGVEVTSCSIEIVPNTEIRSIKVIPNPNASGQMTLVKMNLSSTELTGAKLYLFSITGELLNVIDVTSDEMQIQVPYTQGIFPLRLQLQNGDVLSVNIAVK